ncbi:hypothetical protein AVEN_105771-1 [Araneus ventricosus]|uniref:Uncharacterized protein n=1 Tax=Araneus ventricosus TaxID=182803 RepID=A0A4Y2FZM2_ARAVE|nr:hypothetical protein AVEN_105771-1 [Araneus ventricosus]
MIWDTPPLGGVGPWTVMALATPISISDCFCDDHSSLQPGCLGRAMVTPLWLIVVQNTLPYTRTFIPMRFQADKILVKPLGLSYDPFIYHLLHVNV